jgi:hypothetical protein
MLHCKNKYKWIIIIFCFFHFLFIFGCAGFGLREQRLIKRLPEEYRNHTSGFILSPTKSDIDRAIVLGKNSANDDSLTYAYIIKGPYSIWSGDVYVRIATPLYLISDYARKQTRNYKKIDTPFIEYCKRLDAVKISLTEQYTSSNWRRYAFKRQVILLHNGKPIEPLSTIKSFNGFNPFMSQQNKEIQNIMASYQTFTMTKEQLENLEKTYRSMGYSEAQINTYMNAVRAGTNLVKSSDQNNMPIQISLLKSDAVYKASELKKPGKYEIVFRTPPTNNLIVSGDKEIRFPISFDKFR